MAGERNTSIVNVASDSDGNPDSPGTGHKTRRAKLILI